MSLRKIIKMRGSFPNEEAAMKLLYFTIVQDRFLQSEIRGAPSYN
jgi:transposase-like protein